MSKSRILLGWSLLLTALLLTLGPVRLAPAVQAEDIDVFGYYFLEQPLHTGFRNIELLHLSTFDFRNDQEIKVPLYGWLDLKARGTGNRIHLVNPQRKDKALSFSTSVHKGISYQFTGKFLKLGNFPTNRPEGEIVLTGRLEMYKGKTRLARQDVKFRYSGGD